MYSKKVHTRTASTGRDSAARTILPSRRSYARSKKSYIKSAHSATTAKNTILTVIILLMLIMILFTLYNFIVTPEYLVKREIESITKDYYENYFYSQILENNSLTESEPDQTTFESSMNKIMQKYIEPGFARLSLRQLLLYDDRKHIGSQGYLSDYCDLDKTLIKIYPESPFGHENYRVDYTYSCKF